MKENDFLGCLGINKKVAMPAHMDTTCTHHLWQTVIALNMVLAEVIKIKFQLIQPLTHSPTSPCYQMTMPRPMPIWLLDSSLSWNLITINGGLIKGFNRRSQLITHNIPTHSCLLAELSDRNWEMETPTQAKPRTILNIKLNYLIHINLLILLNNINKYSSISSHTTHMSTGINLVTTK